MLKGKVNFYLILGIYVTLTSITISAYSQIPLKYIKEHDKAIIHTIFSPDNKSIACLTADKTIKIYNSETGELTKILDDKGEGDVTIAFSPDSKYLVSGSWDKSVKIWDLEKGKLLRKLIGHTEATRSVCFNNDGKFIASAGWGDIIKIWYAPTGVNLKNLKGHNQCVRSISFSPNGLFIASCGYDLQLKVWNLAIGNEVFSIKAADFPIECLKYSPDGKYIATAGLENSIKIWDATNGSLIKILKGHTDAVYSIAFSPDGKYLVSGGGDNIVKVWQIDKGIAIFDLKGHSLGIRSVDFSANGKLIVSGAIDKTMRVWDASFFGIIPLQNSQNLTSNLKNESIISWNEPNDNPALSFKRRIAVVAQINDMSFKNIQFFLNKTEYTKYSNNNSEVVKPTSVKITQDKKTEVSYDVYLDYIDNEIQLFAESYDHTSYVFSKPLAIKFFDLNEQLKTTNFKSLIISPEKYNDKKFNTDFERDNPEKFKGIIKTQENKLYNTVSNIYPKSNLELSKKGILKTIDSLALASKKQDVFSISISGIFIKNSENKIFFVSPDADFKDCDSSLLDIETFSNYLNKTAAFCILFINASPSLIQYPDGYTAASDNEIYNSVLKKISSKKDYAVYVISATEHLQLFDILANSLHPLNDLDNNNIIDFKEIITFLKKIYKVQYKYNGRYFPFFMNSPSN